jgi:type 1 glutamine amidotransferase
MSTVLRTMLLVALGLCLAPVNVFAADGAAGGAKKKIFLLAGGPSHGFGAHDHLAGCHLLAKRLNDNVPGVEATVIQGWPKEKDALDDAAAVIMYCDGGGGHMALTHTKELNALHNKGVGIGCIHYAVEVPKGKAGENWIKWMGGYFETHWSVNPHWIGHFTSIPGHPVANGVKPFKTNDEWYYNMRFRENMQGVSPILSAIPPDSTRQGKDDAHGGNPEVRKGIGKNQPEHVVWVSENPNGSRGFGCTGGHVHWNWAQDDFRKTILNAIVWAAKIDVPEKGVESSRPTVDEMLQNHDEKVPENFNKEEMAKRIEEMNKPLEAEGQAAGK